MNRGRAFPRVYRYDKGDGAPTVYYMSYFTYWPNLVCGRKDTGELARENRKWRERVLWVYKCLSKKCLSKKSVPLFCFVFFRNNPFMFSNGTKTEVTIFVILTCRAWLFPWPAISGFMRDMNHKLNYCWHKYSILTSCSFCMCSFLRSRHLKAATLFLSLRTRLFSSSSFESCQKQK